MSSHRNRVAWLVAGFGLFGGCVSPLTQPPPLSPATNAAELSSRSLHDESLRRFLAQNLGHEPAQWDFEALSWVAFYFHPSLDIARAQWATARAAQTTAAARPNPTVSVSPGFSSNPDAGVSPWFPGINFDFLLETSGKRDLRVSVESFSAEAARLNLLSAAWQVRSDLRRALIEAAADERRLPLLRAQTDAQRQLVTLLEQRLAAGTLTTFEISSARVALFKSEAAQADMQGQIGIARSHVAQALGLPVAALEGVTFVDLPSPPSLSSEALAAAQRESLQSRADVLAALARYEAAQAALQLEAAKRYPDIHLGPGYQWDQGQNKWSLGLTVELPLFNRNEGPIAEAAARRGEAVAQLNATQAQVIAAINNAVAAQTAATVQLDHAHRLRAELEKQSALVQSRLTAGGADRVDLQTAQLELNTADLVLADSAAAAAGAAGQIEDALQVPFPNLNAIATASRAATQSHTP
jgi:cobalt-zinc-cadmium efflux system outer membrane protein